jgi:hypothetical protein
MASYYINEATCELPERTFVDKTIHALEAKLPSGKSLAVFVHRRPIEEDKTLLDLVDANVALNQMRLSGYAVLEQAEANLAGVAGILLRTRWRQQGTMLYQLQAHVAYEGALLIFAVSGPFAEQAACDETFDTILETLVWRT